MKHIYYLFIGMLFLASSCAEKELTDAFALSGILEVEEEILTLKQEKQVKSFEVKGVATFELDSSKVAPWCKLLRVQDYNSKNLVTCYIEENTQVDARETSFNLISGNQKLPITIKQLGNAPNILLSQDSVLIGRDTTALRINIVSNVEYELSKSEGAWFSFEEKTNAKGVKYLAIPVSPNNSGATRTGEIIFNSPTDEADKTFLIKQSHEQVDYEQIGAEGVEGNIHINILSANASSILGESKMSKSYDDKPLSYYQSDWQNISEEPLYLEYFLESEVPLSYFEYTPYSADTDKGIKKVQVWAKSEGDADYRLIQTETFSANSMQTVKLKEDVLRPVALKLMVQSIQGAGTDGKITATCAEIDFYSTTSLYGHVFTGPSCSELKPEVSINDILSIEDDFYRNIAYHLFHGTYNPARIRHYGPYIKTGSSILYWMMQGKYSLLSNATGISVLAEDEIIFLAEDIGSKNVYIRLIDPARPQEYVLYKINEGVNKHTMKFDGLLYVDYHTSKATEEPVRIHISGGQDNGVYHIGDEALDLQKTNYPYIDLMGEKAHLLYRKEDLSKLTSPDELLQKYDQIILTQQQFIGMEKYQIDMKNKMSFIAVDDEEHYFKTHIECPINKMSELCDPSQFKGEILWDLSHKIGKNHLNGGMLYSGLKETIPSLYTLYVEQQLGLSSSSYFIKEEMYQDAFMNILMPEKKLNSFADSYDFMNERIIPFWQLYIYASKVLGKKDFFADLYYKLQYQTATLDRHLPKFSSELLEVDLSEFFNRWGFGNVKPATRYPLAPRGLKYLTEDNVELFKNQQEPIAGTYSRSGKNITINDSENFVAFEVRHSFYPTQVSLQSTFTVEEWKPSMIVLGIGVNGEEVTIPAQ